MAMLVGIEFDLAVVVETSGEAAIRVDRFDNSKFAIGDTE
jgi:hypothetical protein